MDELRALLAPLGEEVEAFRAFVARYDRFLVATHIYPDGDAVGSVTAMGRALRRLGKEVVLACPGPLKERWHVVPEAETIVTPTEGGTWPLDPGWPQALIVVDCSDLGRLDSLEGLLAALARPLPVAQIDHHVTNDRFGEVNLVTAEAVATCQLLHALFLELGWELDRTLAQQLLTGLTTDTLGYRIAAVGPRELREAAALMEAGADYWRIVDGLFNARRFEVLQLEGRVLAGARREDGLVWAVVPQVLLREAGADLGEAEGIVNRLVATAGTRVAVLFKEGEDGRTRVSFRSRPGFDVARIAHRFGGGGHPQASGCTFDGSVDEAVEAVLAEVRRALRTAVPS